MVARPTAKQAADVAPELISWLGKFVYKSLDRTRTHITSPKLCDDILERLSPSLPPQHSCDIIDLNPGACLWSRKIHDVLRPRRHVLVEPHLATYREWIDPLLLKPDSTYRLASSINEVFDPTSNILSSKLNHPSSSAIGSSSDSAAHYASVNESLLIIANLTAKMAKSRFYEGSGNKYWLNSYYTSIFSPKLGLHRYGLVRMLAWMPDEEKSTYIPRTVAGRTRQSVQMEATFHVNEIAGGSSYQTPESPLRRIPQLEVESQQIVAQKQERNGTNSSTDRQRQLPPRPSASIEITPENLQTLKDSPGNPPWVDELAQLDQQFRTGQIERYIRATRKASINPKKQQTEQTSEYKRFRAQLTRRLSLHKAYLRCIELIHQQRRLEQESKVLSQPNHDIQITGDITRRHENDLAELKKEMISLHANDLIFVKKGVDDCRAFDLEPPVLSWDNREAEPLLICDEEFFPRRSLALLDFRPRTDLFRRLDTPDKRTCFDHVTSVLLQKPNLSIPQALSPLVPAGLDVFLAKVPSLLDLRKGGNSDLDDVRVRALPASTFIEIALAWESWPFRASTETLMTQNTAPGIGQELFLDPA